MCELFWGQSELGYCLAHLKTFSLGDQVFEVISWSLNKNENLFWRSTWSNCLGST